MKVKFEKMNRGLGFAVELIIVLDFLREVYAYLKPRIKNIMARRNDEQPEEEVVENEPEE